MDWTDRDELAYRVFARQHEDTSLHFDQMREGLLALYSDGVSFGDVTESYWICPAEDIEKARSKGYLLVDVGNVDDLRLVVRELPVVISVGLGRDAESLITDLCEHFGSVFASVRIVSEALTEIQAV